MPSPVTPQSRRAYSITDWHRDFARAFAASIPLENMPTQARGALLAARNDEPEPDHARRNAPSIQGTSTAESRPADAAAQAGHQQPDTRYGSLRPWVIGGQVVEAHSRLDIARRFPHLQGTARLLHCTDPEAAEYEPGDVSHDWQHQQGGEYLCACGCWGERDGDDIVVTAGAVA